MSILQRNKKAAAGIGVAALAVAAIALGTGTYAAFTSTQGGPGGTLAAGTLQLDVTSSPNATAQLFSADNIAPGYTSEPRTVTMVNSGSLDGKLSATVTVTPNSGGSLQNYLTVGGGCTVDGAGVLSVPAGTPVSALANGFTNMSLPHGKTATCTFTFAFPDNGGDQNDAQGDKVDIASNFTLTQA